MRLRNYNTAKIIKQARISKGYSQKDLHLTLNPAACRVPMHISNIERNKAPVPPKMVNRLCNTLGIPKEVLIEQMVQDYRISLIEEVDKWTY